MRANAGSIYNLGGIWTGDVLANTGGIYNNVANSTTNPNGVNAAQWSGDVVTNNGLIMNFALGTWTGEVLANAGDIANYGSWIGNLTTSGRIIHTGVWTGDVINSGTYFHAENQIVGAFDNRGWLQLTGNLSGITTLTNSGRLVLTQTSGAQTLSVGSAVLTPSSSYEINVTAAGASDRLIVSGNATLGGTVRVLAATTGGPYTSPTAYTILTAGSISGTFAGVTTDLAFFAPHLTYDATAAYLTLKRNDVGFSTAGVTANQIGVGTTVEALRAGNPLYDAVLWLTQPEAEQAFDDLSVEAYASSESMALQNSNLVRDIALGRLRQIFEKPEQGDGSASGYAGRPILAAHEGTGTGFWTQFYGAVGISAATGETSSLFASTGGVAIGLDGAAGPWNIGLTVHAGASSNAVPALGSRIDSGDYGLGIYGGGEWGNTRLALGADYTRHAIHSTRSVSFPGFADALSADYAAGTVQAFAELSQRLDLGAVALTPYADLAYVSHATDGFAETWGAAALTSAGSVVDATFTTLGMRAEQKFVVGDAMLLTANAALGWRHSFADAPSGTYALAGGSNFDIVGAPIASDVLVLSAGLNLDVSETSALDLTYDGQVGAGSQTHALKATWATQF